MDADRKRGRPPIGDRRMTTAEAQRRLAERRRAEGIPTNRDMRSVAYDAIKGAWDGLPDAARDRIAVWVRSAAKERGLDPDRTAAAFLEIVD